jgi:hypothetical protein
MPTEKQMEKLAADVARRNATAANKPSATRGPADDMPQEYWDAVLRDPRGDRLNWIPIQNRRLSEISRHILRVSCRRCDRIVEIQTADAMRLYGQHAIWKDVGPKLLDDGCRTRTGNRDDDGCWPAFE